MTLAIAFTVLGWIASITELRADESAAIDISSTSSSRISFVALAADKPAAEASSPSDIGGNQPAPTPMPANNHLSPDASVTQDLGMFHGYRPPMPFGPSGTPSILQYMSCDPHSCPNIWAGYEAQRAADLAKKCTPPGGGCCGVGCGGCGGTSLYGMACVDCQHRARKVVNRYRQAPAATGCSTGSGAACDSLTIDSSVGGCNPSQASTKPTEDSRLSEAPTPAKTR